MTDIARDLFGEVIVPPRRSRGGRPRHEPTEERRRMVASLHAEGQAQPDIAAALGITVPTMILNYAAELESNSRSAERLAARRAATLRAKEK